jgi:hypothetical protein
MDRISWTDRVRNEVVLLRVNEKRNIVQTIKRKKANWLVTACVGSAFCNTLFNNWYKGREDEEEGTSS